MKQVARRLYGCLLLSSSLILFGFGYGAFFKMQNGLPFRTVNNKDSRALYPVYDLITNIKNRQWGLLKQSFSDQGDYDSFISVFKTGGGSGGVFERVPSFIVLKTYSPQSKAVNPDYRSTVEISAPTKSSGKITLEITTRYDDIIRQYLITSLQIEGAAENWIQAMESNEIVIPELSQSTCGSNSESGFSYVLLRNRETDDAPIQEHIPLAERDFQTYQSIPADFHDTDAISQLEFPAREIGDEKYFPGFVISARDAQEFALGSIFRNISDGVGVLQVPFGNTWVDYPVGFFLDNWQKRIVILANESNSIGHYDGRGDQYLLANPVAICAVGEYLYILDAGHSPNIKVLRMIFLPVGILHLEKVAQTDFDLDLNGATDLTGFATANQSVLYVSNPVKSVIYRVPLDNGTGLMDGDLNVHEFTAYLDQNNNREPLGSVLKLESTPRNSSTGSNILVGILENNSTISFETDGLEESPSLNLLHYNQFPVGSTLYNIGYNIGEKAFYVTDYTKGKTHILSGNGSFLGSGGEFGKSEHGKQLYYPTLISSNNFSEQANEMIVGSQWGWSTGLKRIVPRSDIGAIEVIEKAPANPLVDDDMLYFRYALTSGFNARSVTLKVNGQTVKTISEGLYAGVHGEYFLTGHHGPNGIKDLLKLGWNTYEVELVGSIEGPTNADLTYRRVRSRQFYFLPSLSDSYSVSVAPSDTATFNRSVDNPLYIYKNMFVTGGGVFTAVNTKMIFMEGCTLKIAKERNVLVDNAILQFACGANFELSASEEFPKLIKNTTFTGAHNNYNMVRVVGDFTGGVGSGSAPSSKMEFISCRFNEYVGKALYVAAGRVAVVNSDFEGNLEGTTNATETSVGIAVESAKVDVRGGSFFNNSIAIDSYAADLFVGHSNNVYKGDKVRELIFSRNRIGIHSFGSVLDLTQGIYKGNDVAVIELSGLIVIGRNRSNTFESNQRAIVFSKSLLGKSGKNRFVNNDSDITYMSPGASNEDFVFDVECNFWQHGTEVGSPIIEMMGAEADSDIIFDFDPYLEIKGNGSFTCTGTSPLGKLNTTLVGETSAHEYHQKITSEISRLTEGVDPITQLQPRINDLGGKIYWGRYSSDTLAAFHQAVTKRFIEMVLLNRHQWPSERSLHQYLETSSLHNDRYIDITLDKLQFLFQLKSNVYVENGVTEYSANVEESFVVFPNPAMDGEAKVLVQVSVDGSYSIEVVNNQGQTRKILTSRYLVAGSHSIPIEGHLKPGIYVLQLHDESGRRINVTRLVIQ